MASSEGDHWNVDASPASVLVECRACGTRFIAATRRPAMLQLAAHLRGGHRLLAAAQNAARASTVLDRRP